MKGLKGVEALRLGNRHKREATTKTKVVGKVAT